MNFAATRVLVELEAAVHRALLRRQLLGDRTLDEVAVYNKALTATPGRQSLRRGVPGDVIQRSDRPRRRDPPPRPRHRRRHAGNPFASSTDPNARRIIAYGFRNPFRFTFRPGTNELWVGDVGLEHVGGDQPDRQSRTARARTSAGPATRARRAARLRRPQRRPLREPVRRGPAAVTAPYYAYNHSAKVVAGETCPVGSSSIAGMAFYPERAAFPAAYRGGAVLRRLHPQLHLVHAQGRQRPARSRPARRRSRPARPTRWTSRSARTATSSTSTSTRARSAGSATGRQPAADRPDRRTRPTARRR